MVFSRAWDAGPSPCLWLRTRWGQPAALNPLPPSYSSVCLIVSHAWHPLPAHPQVRPAWCTIHNFFWMAEFFFKIQTPFPICSHSHYMKSPSIFLFFKGRIKTDRQTPLGVCVSYFFHYQPKKIDSMSPSLRKHPHAQALRGVLRPFTCQIFQFLFHFPRFAPAPRGGWVVRAVTCHKGVLCYAKKVWAVRISQFSSQKVSHQLFFSRTLTFWHKTNRPMILRSLRGLPLSELTQQIATVDSSLFQVWLQSYSDAAKTAKSKREISFLVFMTPILQALGCGLTPKSKIGQKFLHF